MTQFKALTEVIGLAQCPLQMLGLSENHGATPEAMAAMGRAMAANQSLVSRTSANNDHCSATQDD